MPEYKIVRIQDADSDEVMGYNLIKGDAEKLRSVTLFTEEEAVALAQGLEERQHLMNNWPDARDPEVQEILGWDDFMPPQTRLDGTVGYTPSEIGERQQMAMEIVARERAGLTS